MNVLVLRPFLAWFSTITVESKKICEGHAPPCFGISFDILDGHGGVADEPEFYFLLFGDGERHQYQ